VVNKMRGTFSCAAVKAPGFGDRRKAMLEDIAVLTGGRAILQDLGIDLANLALTDLGQAKKVIITKDNTTIIEGAGASDAIQGRIKQIKNEIDSTTSDYDREKFQERLAKISGGVAQINVGAATELEMKEKKARVEDALNATRAAVEEGILPGGGLALYRSIEILDKIDAKGDASIGIGIIRRALSAPLVQIVKNSGVDGAVVVEKLRTSTSPSEGYDANKGEYCDLFEAGIIDPTKVVRCALQNATSVATLLLTTDALVAEIPEKKGAAAGGMPGGGMY
jgi:chaperonin GroEL